MSDDKKEVFHRPYLFSYKPQILILFQTGSSRGVKVKNALINRTRFTTFGSIYVYTVYSYFIQDVNQVDLP